MRRIGATGVALGAALILSLVGVPAGAQAEPAPGDPAFRNVVTFDFLGKPELYEVPPQVVCATLDAYGAAGGGNQAAAGGKGGHARVPVALRPGETLVVIVGGSGDAHQGYNGGGDGSGGQIFYAAPGGGASEIKRGGDAGGAGAQRLLVAGGGGGAGGGAGVPPYGTPPTAGGGGGGLTGAAGGGGDNAGRPGTQTGPGTIRGGAGQGGVGGSSSSGGGGGGGFFGGAGGAGAIGGGGGGSGTGPAGTTFETGVRGGDGQVTITYTDNDRSCIKGAPTTTDGGAARVHAADPAITPGAVDPAVDTRDVKQESCDGSAARDRRLDADDQNIAYRAYGVPEDDERPHTIDHLVPTALGGTDDPANLWPQTDAQAEQKDRAEAKALRAVCDGSMTLDEARASLVARFTGDAAEADSPVQVEATSEIQGPLTLVAFVPNRLDPTKTRVAHAAPLERGTTSIFPYPIGGTAGFVVTRDDLEQGDLVSTDLLGQATLIPSQGDAVLITVAQDRAGVIALTYRYR